MITLQSVMLVALGVFTAGFFGLFLAPLYRKRAAKLAIQDLKSAMPLSEAEIRADKDRLRAENAIAIHRLETRLEESGLVAARQRVEINRRDAAISGLESEVSRLGTILDEHENARRVLEQTITERLPMVERRLSEAKDLLSQRDKEIGILSQSANKNARALEEATQINTRQREDLHRLNATLATRQAHNRSSFADAGVETEIALRGEIEALRAKARDQSELIDRLKAGRTAASVSAVNQDADSAERSADADADKLRIDLAEAQQALRVAQGETRKGKDSRSSLETELEAMKGEADRLRSELSRLKAALNVYESTDKEQQATKETKVALKARVGSLENELSEQADVVRRLRAEIAANNDKMARQAAHYVDVIRRLGGGTQPVTGPAATRAGDKTPKVAASTAQPRSYALLDRLKAPRKDGRAMPKSVQSAEATQGAKPSVREEAKVSDFIKALGGNGASPAHPANANQATLPTDSQDKKPVPTAERTPPDEVASNTPTASAAGNNAGKGNGEGDGSGARPQRRPGLLERLASGD